MYILHYRRKRSHSIFFVALLLIGLGTGAYYSRDFLDTETSIGPAPAAVYSKVTDNRPQPKKIDMPQYSFTLPNDWEQFSVPNARAGLQSWRNTKDNKGVRVITVYLDADNRDMAVNRALPVDPAGDKFVINGDVSDNCLNFTNNKADGSGHEPAKWQGTDFICDTGNKFRNFVGLGGKGTPVGIELTGSTTGKHTIYITYDDSGPNFSAADFNEMVKNFKLK